MIEQSVNKSPVVVVQDKLGIESWCIKHVYCYANKTFLELKNAPNFKDMQRLVELTRVLVMVNPEYASAWNSRKDLIRQNILDPLEELDFSELILKKKPKSSDAFAHRRFLILFVIENFKDDNHDLIGNLVDHELKLCTKTAEKYSRNYYSWCHRLWMIQDVCKENPEILRQEMDFLTTWIPSHVSEYSAFNYRQVLLSKMLPKIISPEAKLEIISQEYSLLDSLFAQFLGRESLFLYRRFLFSCIHSIVSSGQVLDAKEQLKNFEDQEKDFLSRQFVQMKQCKNAWHLHLSRQQVKWIKAFLQNDSWTVKNAF